MSNVTNLNQFKKTKARAQKRARADQNAVKFGRTKAQKTLEGQQLSRSIRDLDGHLRAQPPQDMAQDVAQDMAQDIDRPEGKATAGDPGPGIPSDTPDHPAAGPDPEPKPDREPERKLSVTPSPEPKDP